MKTVWIILAVLGMALADSRADDHPLANFRVVRVAKDVQETILLSKDDPRPEWSWKLRSTGPRMTIIREGDAIDGMIVTNVNKTNRTFQLEKDGKVVQMKALPEGPQTNHWVILEPIRWRLKVGDGLKNGWTLSAVAENGSATFTNKAARSFVVPFQRTEGSNQAFQATGAPESSQRVFDDPVAALRSVLPPGWSVLRAEKNPTPFYRPPGKGQLIVLARHDADSVKHGQGDRRPEGVHVYIMAADYDDGGPNPTRGEETQSRPPCLIGADRTARIYMWPYTSESKWKTLKEDVLRALKKD